MIALDTLPKLPLSDRRRLPNCSAVYIVHDDSGRCLYVGSSTRLAFRWVQHEKFEAISEYRSPIISWIETPVNNLLLVERNAIIELRPVLNRDLPSPRGMVKIRIVGGAICVTIPQQFVRTFGIEVGDLALVEIGRIEGGQDAGNGILITPQPKKNGARK